MWFEKLTGFEEMFPYQVRKGLFIEGDQLVSKVNGKRYDIGFLNIPTLSDLRAKMPFKYGKGEMKLSEHVGDVRNYHVLKENQRALFQAASQFNLLEMVSPYVCPEDGVDRYENDLTQGPACAISCGAGTIYRNYFIPFDNGDEKGQTKDRQVDCLSLIGDYFNEQIPKAWEMSNGYPLFNEEGLLKVNKIIAGLSNEEREYLKGMLQVGIQSDTQVTISENYQKVSQIYCSAIPISYNRSIEKEMFEPFAKLVLEATYEATVIATILNDFKFKSNKLFLTLVGGGAFGNPIEWIKDSMLNALYKFRHYPLDIGIISYGSSNRDVVNIIESFDEIKND